MGRVLDTIHTFGRIQRHPYASAATKIPRSLLGGLISVLQHDYRRSPHEAWLRAHQPCQGINTEDTIPERASV